ncbi:hypothetical protein UFOVP1324_51 [uncultured Caudovirales phage]|uniref:Uncharacterized protein n=1 Tax=uncultured Caudovirales phage TaxID=2100421 RepID=A0A6J5S1Q7_9CAUD|nr:hypothetical protein UFOVP1324_51 [uncultured Caudovirales phage]
MALIGYIVCGLLGAVGVTVYVVGFFEVLRISGGRK